MNQNFPPGWDEERVRKALAHYEGQTEDDKTFPGYDPARWKVADDLCKRLIAVANTELNQMRKENRLEPMQVFAGIAMALLSLMASAPAKSAPTGWVRFEAHLVALLRQLFRDTV
jgi:hypothetical protein